MDYDDQQNIYVKRVNKGKNVLSDLKITVKAREEGNQKATDSTEYQYNPNDYNGNDQKIVKRTIVLEDDSSANNQDNELDGVYISGMDEQLLASAKLTF